MKMDNQQATSWLCGFIDGEGSFRDTKKSGIQTRISNTEVDAIGFCETNLTRLGIDNSMSDWKRKGKKREYEICISSWTDNYQLYNRLDSSLCRINELEAIIGASETTREATSNIDWLAGMYEAEGSFSIGRVMTRGNKPNYQVQVCISNKRCSIIDQIVLTLSNNQLSYYITDHYPTNPKHAPYQAVGITGMLRCYRFLDTIQPYLRTSKYRIKCELIIEYINSRLSKVRTEPYSDREHEIYHRLKQMI
jgi:hypothetical protein